MVLEKQLPTSDLKAVINEAKCMNILTHPNIPQLLGVEVACKPYSLIMEFIGEDNKSSTVHQLTFSQRKFCVSRKGNFLPVGHTHEGIDALFGMSSKHLRLQDV